MIRAELRSCGLGLQVRLLVLDDVEPARDWLADCAVVLWHGFRLAEHRSRGCQEMRLLHGALRSVADLALRGARWQSAQAPALDHALALALAEIDGAMRTMPVVQHDTMIHGHAIREGILHGWLSAEMIPGAEVYAA